VKIQSAFRGYITRKYIQHIKENQYYHHMNDQQFNGDGEQNYHSNHVLQIREEKGEFNFNQDPEIDLSHCNLEQRDHTVLENGAQYQGEWDLNTGNRCGKGI
jgi:hypothetical protein